MACWVHCIGDLDPTYSGSSWHNVSRATLLRPNSAHLTTSIVIVNPGMNTDSDQVESEESQGESEPEDAEDQEGQVLDHRRYAVMPCHPCL